MPKTGKKKSIWNYFQEAKVIVLTTHVRPDGDGIASELALSIILKSLGKKVFIVNQDRTPEMYRWLPHSSEIITLAENGKFSANAIDLTVLIDCSSKERIGSVYEVIQHSRKIISVDHHVETQCFKDECYVDTNASSIGEVLYMIVPNIAKHLNPEIATCLYASLLTDTGSFTYSNTSPRTLKIASHLLECGIDPSHMYRNIFCNRRINSYRLFGRALELLRTDETEKVVYIILPYSVYRETDAREEDTEGIIEGLYGLRNVELIIMIRELEDHRIKGSLRSISHVDCVLLAKMFGGGGHFGASGFVIEGDIDRGGHEVVERIINEVKRKGWI